MQYANWAEGMFPGPPLRVCYGINKRWPVSNGWAADTEWKEVFYAYCTVGFAGKRLTLPNRKHCSATIRNVPFLDNIDYKYLGLLDRDRVFPIEELAGNEKIIDEWPESRNGMVPQYVNI